MFLRSRSLACPRCDKAVKGHAHSVLAGLQNEFMIISVQVFRVALLVINAGAQRYIIALDIVYIETERLVPTPVIGDSRRRETGIIGGIEFKFQRFLTMGNMLVRK